MDPFIEKYTGLKPFIEKYTVLKPRVAYNEIMEEINKRLLKDGCFGKLIDIIGDPKVLLIAYLNIKGKPGNMTPGYHGKGYKPETLEFIDLLFFQRLSMIYSSSKD